MADTRTLYSEVQIQARVEEIASEIARDYKGKKPILLGILKGSFVFLSDLLRALHKKGLVDVEVDFMTVSSYGSGTEYSGQSNIISDASLELKGRDVIVVEDIIDTGHTLAFVLKHLEMKRPASLRLATILDKKEKREVEIPVDYIGFTIKGKPWVEGYGLDGGQYGRGRPEIVEKTQ